LKFVKKFEDENLYEKPPAEIEFCKIDPRISVSSFGMECTEFLTSDSVTSTSWQFSSSVGNEYSP
jgi:hypothetical protein